MEDWYIEYPNLPKETQLALEEYIRLRNSLAIDPESDQYKKIQTRRGELYNRMTEIKDSGKSLMFIPSNFNSIVATNQAEVWQAACGHYLLTPEQIYNRSRATNSN